MTGVTDLFSVDGKAVVVAVHVQPRAGRTAVVGRHGQALKVRVAAPPVDDRANVAAAALLAEVLDVAPSKVTLVGGGRSRLKRFRVDDVEAEDVVRGLRRALDEAAAPPGGGRRQLPG